MRKQSDSKLAETIVTRVLSNPNSRSLMKLMGEHPEKALMCIQTLLLQMGYPKSAITHFKKQFLARKDLFGQMADSEMAGYFANNPAMATIEGTKNALIKRGMPLEAAEAAVTGITFTSAMDKLEWSIGKEDFDKAYAAKDKSVQSIRKLLKKFIEGLCTASGSQKHFDSAWTFDRCLEKVRYHCDRLGLKIDDRPDSRTKLLNFKEIFYNRHGFHDSALFGNENFCRDCIYAAYRLEKTSRKA